MSKIRIDNITKRIFENKLQSLQSILPPEIFYQLSNLLEVLLREEYVESEELTKVLLLLNSVEEMLLRAHEEITEQESHSDNKKEKEKKEDNVLIQIGLLSNQIAMRYLTDIRVMKKQLQRITKGSKNNAKKSRKTIKRY